MGPFETTTDLIDDDPDALDWLSPIGARLHCFAGRPGDLTSHDGQIQPTTIHKLSLRRVTTQSVPDLRIGSIVRLRIPRLGWRHLEVRWIASGVAGCDFLLPLLPFELGLAKNLLAKATALPPPPRRGNIGPAVAAHASSAVKTTQKRLARRRPVAEAEAAALLLLEALDRMLTGSSIAIQPGVPAAS